LCGDDVSAECVIYRRMRTEEDHDVSK